tara:strand:- start:847 stop:1122 length:276 start_codon:yes stop_codon:yes gene_type:complete
MLVRKIEKGFYEVIDDQNNNYRIEDQRRAEKPNGLIDQSKLACPNPRTILHGRWCIYEQSEGEWVYLDDNKTLKECLTVIETWAAASELGT